MWEWSVERTAAERPYWLAFSTLPLLGTTRLLALIDHFGSLRAAWEHGSEAELRGCPELGDVLVRQILRLPRRAGPAALADQLTNGGSRLLIPPDPDYPDLLRHIHSPPATLYSQGDYQPGWFRRAVAVVGTRNATGDGLVMAYRLGAGLAEAGVTVVSGMAFGIDAQAHMGALAVPHGRTVAVLASGADVPSPPSQRFLHARLKRLGLVVSEYADGTEPQRMCFPARNRIVSGLCAAVVIVEAPEKSGALITVDFAQDQGREVFAVPSSAILPQSRGVNQLLKDGARLVTSAADVLDELGWRPRPPAQGPPPPPPVLYGDEASLFQALTCQGETVERLIRASGLAAQRVSRVLLQLEIRGLVQRTAGNRYMRSH